MRNSHRLLFAAGLSFFSGLLLREWAQPSRDLGAEPAREWQLARDLEDLFARVAEDVKLSVVAIDASPPPGHADSSAEGGPDHGVETESIGSGFIVDPRGYILTNHHLVGGGGALTVRLADERELPGRVVQTDYASDTALIKVEAEGLHALPMGDSEEARVGQWVLAIGNPFGLTRTVSAGIISALERSDLRILPFEEFIQTDASINPGNSGGPLVNLRGEALGINTAIYTGPGGGSQGIGFAVPIRLAKALVKRWIEGKNTSYAGVEPARVDADMAAYYKLPEARGAFLRRVDPDGPAARGGLAAMDLIVSFAGSPVRDENHLRLLIASAAPNEPVEVEVLRRGRNETFRIVPHEKGPPGPQPPPPPASPPETRERTRLLGLTVTPLGPEIAAQLGLDPGTDGMAVIDVQAGSSASKKGLRRSDVIVEVNERPVASLESLKSALDASGPVVMLRVERGNAELGCVFLPR
ncbi:MAG TPA: trypsin-like peptidase domain-containing protein [Planctomycetota bacterium]|nr:trypsin-like peptidase domain-containing protein [Planctomycetota bacterium]